MVQPVKLCYLGVHQSQGFSSPLYSQLSVQQVTGICLFSP